MNTVIRALLKILRGNIQVDNNIVPVIKRSYPIEFVNHIFNEKLKNRIKYFLNFL